MLTWTATNGSTIEIEARLGIGGAVVVARIDGKEVANQYGPSVLPKPVPANGCTVVASVGKVGLNAERYEIVKAMFEAVADEYDNTPEGLEGIRNDLLGDLAAAHDEADYRHRRRVESASVTGVVGSADEHSALDALEAFDAAHPEIVAQLKAERSDRVSRAD